MNDKLYDVIAVNIETGEERFIAQGKTIENAEAIEIMAIMRRGCDVEFFKKVQ